MLLLVGAVIVVLSLVGNIHWNDHSLVKHGDDAVIAKNYAAELVSGTTCPPKWTKAYYSELNDNWILVCTEGREDVWYYFVGEVLDGDLFEVASGRFRSSWIMNQLRNGAYKVVVP